MLLNQMSSNRFRGKIDVTPYLFREWQKLSGKFYAKNIQKYITYLEIQDDTTRLIKAIEKQKSKIICINDAMILRNPDSIRMELQEAFEKILPKPSSFEKKRLR